MVYSVEHTDYNELCTDCDVNNMQGTVYSILVGVYDIQFTVKNVKCTVYSVQLIMACTVCSEQCSVYSK